MSDDPELHISDVVHTALIEVNEEGTVAAAATAVIMKTRSLGPPPLRLTFDRPTDRAGMGLATAGAKGSGLYGDKRYVDALCDFSEPLAYDYSGEWSDDPLSPASEFLITITQSTCPGCTPMTGIATVKVRGSLRNCIAPQHTHPSAQ